jgi:dolichol-phosphate mannosyltransferase
MISMIIPTYNERDNLELLISRISSALKGMEAEIIIVDDDSPDRTWELAQELAARTPGPRIRVIRRINERGLSSAVIRGFRAAEGGILGVMDADLSHPPEVIPEAIKEMDNSDMVIASRYVPGGVCGLSFGRKIVSSVATLMARPLTRASDPMSGFFFVRKNLIEGMRIRPRGFKILLDIASSPKPKRISEVPYSFFPRTSGSSKMSPKTMLDYVRQLAYLYTQRILRARI